MADGDSIRFEATFNNLDEAVELFTGELTEQLAKAEAMGEEAMASIIRSQIQRVGGAGAGAGEVEQEAAALQRVNVLRQRGMQVDLEMLDTLREQNSALAEQAALAERLQRAPETGGVIVPRERRYTGYEQTAGQQAAAERELAETQAYVNEMVDAEGAGRARLLELEREQLAVAQRQAAAQARIAELQASPAHAWDVTAGTSAAYDAGSAAASRGSMVPGPARKALTTGPGAQGEGWTASEQALARYNLALGEYERFDSEASMSTEALTANLTRLGVAENEASNSMRVHGALTTEYLQALARGETTVGEFGYQIGATVAKFAGWTVAATATYAALGAVTEFGKGAIDTASSVQQLTRTIDNLDRQQAATGLQNLSQQTNVPIKEAGDAVFAYSRTFHQLPDAIAAARLGLAAFKLDNVSIADSVKVSTVLNQQYGISAQGLGSIYNMLSAGQREYNARISDMIPLLQKASGAVKNAGGDLDTLTQLGVYAQRTTQLGGSQVGTAFYRSAATFLNPSTTKGASDQEVLKSLGINPSQGWTQIITEALQKSLTLSPADRTKLANAIFGPQYGGRLSAIFSPSNVPEFQRIQRTITPQATQGSLQTELQRQLHTTGEELHSFINGLQRMGAALGESGVITDATDALRVFVGAMEEVRKVADAFDTLPGTARNVVVAVEAITAALLFMSRTRFGSSLADATRLSRVPGVGPSAAQRATFTLRVGTRAAQDEVGRDISTQTARATSLGAQGAALGQRRAALDAEIEARRAAGASEAEITELMERSSGYAVRIKALEAQRVEVEAELAASYQLQESLTEQQTRLRKSSRRGGYTSQERLSLAGAVGAGTNAEAGAVEQDTAAQGRLASVKRRIAERIAANDVAAMGAAEAMEAETAAATTASVESAETAGLLSRAGTRMRGFAAALDPLTVAMIGVPIVLSEVSGAINSLNQADDAARNALKEPVNSVDALRQQAADLQKAAAQQGKGHAGILDMPLRGWGDLLGGSFGRSLQRLGGGDQGAASQSRDTASTLTALSQEYQHQANLFTQDAAAMAGTAQGRARLTQEAQRLRDGMQRALKVSGLTGQEGQQIYDAFTAALAQQYQKAINAASTKSTTAKDPSSMMAQFETALAAQPTVVATELQSFDDYQKIFGQNQQALNSALARYSALVSQAAKPANRTNDQLFQQVTSAQSNITSSVQSVMDAAQRSAALATTNEGELKALTGAVSSIQSTESTIRRWAGQVKNQPKLVQALNELSGLLAQSADQAIQSVLQQLQSQSGAAVSRIQGISPEADLARAQAAISGAGGLQAQLAYAKSHGADAQTINQLWSSLNNALTDYQKQQVQYAQGIEQAKGQLAQSAVTGVSPADDLKRAQLAVDAARTNLAFVQSHGLGLQATLQAQSDLNQAVYSLNEQMISNAQQIQQDAAGLIQANTDLQVANTLNPIDQAREQLAGDTRLLSTIKPSQYKTYAEYLAAYREQQSKVATDQRNVTSQIVSTQMSTLQFQFDTQRISSQQYINGLQGLLKLHKLTLQQTQQIEQQIYDTAHSTAVNLNTGNIALPTTYEVRRAFTSAVRAGLQSRAGGVGQAGQSAVVQNNNVTNHVGITIQVAKGADLKGVADVLDKALNSNLTAAAQAAGVLGS